MTALTISARWASDLVSDINPDTGEKLNASISERLLAVSKAFDLSNDVEEKEVYFGAIKALTQLRQIEHEREIERLTKSSDTKPWIH